MNDFEKMTLGKLLNEENLKDDCRDNLDELFNEIENDNDEKIDQEEKKEKDESEIEEDEEIEEEEKVELNDEEDNSYRDRERSYINRDRQEEKFNDIFGNNNNDSEFDKYIIEINTKYKHLKKVDLFDDVFPDIKDIKTLDHAKQVLRLTTTTLDTSFYKESFNEIIPTLASVVQLIFNGERTILGKKPDAKNYHLKIKDKMKHLDNELTSTSSKIATIRGPFSSLLKYGMIIFIPLITTIKDNHNIAEQGLKHENLSNMNHKI